MNRLAFGHSCVCLLRLQASRSTNLHRSMPIKAITPWASQCRNMSVWYMVKNRFKQAWSEQVKSESSKSVGKYGIEIGTADSLAKIGARVQFSNRKWYDKKDIVKGSLPVEELRGETVFAIDAKESEIDRFIMADVAKLSQLKYLSLEGCRHVDDFCLGSLVHLRDTLTHLNINKCTDITENGVATLHKLRNLERLNMNDMPKVNHAPLVAVLLEDVLPQLRISLVSRQVERYVEDARRGMEIIQEHRQKEGIMEQGGSEGAERGQIRGEEVHQNGQKAEQRHNKDSGKTVKDTTREDSGVDDEPMQKVGGKR